MALLNETGSVVIRFGLNQDGDEEFNFETDNVSTFEAWAGVRLVADILHEIVMSTFASGAEDDDDPDA